MYNKLIFLTRCVPSLYNKSGCCLSQLPTQLDTLPAIDSKELRFLITAKINVSREEYVGKSTYQDVSPAKL